MTEKKQELLELGFSDSSYVEDGIDYTEFVFTDENFKIEISGIDRVEIYFPSCGWVNVPSCKTIEDLKCLIKLFSDDK